MKKIICSAMIFMLLCGCSNKKSESFQLNHQSLSTVFSVEIEGTHYEGYMSFDKNLNSFFTLSKPDFLKGYSVSVIDGSVTSSFEKVSSTFDISDFDDTFCFAELTKIIRGFYEGKAEVNSHGENYTVSLNGNSLAADSSGKPVSGNINGCIFTFS